MSIGVWLCSGAPGQERLRQAGLGAAASVRLLVAHLVVGAADAGTVTACTKSATE